MVRTTDIVDYAYPTMMAENAMKALHQAALRRDWEEAREQALVAIEWMAEVHSALRVMEREQP